MATNSSVSSPQNKKMELGDLKKDKIQYFHGNGKGIPFREHLESDGQVHGNGSSFHFHELVDLNQDQVQDPELDQNQIQNIQGKQDQIQGIGNYSRERRSSKHVLQGSRCLIQFEYDEERAFSLREIQVEESNQQIISHSSSGNCFILKIGAISTNKLKPYQSKTSIVLSTITAQLAGSLLAVTKQGSGSTPRVQVLALLYTSALSNAIGFLASLGGFWIQRARPGAASTMEKVGCAFTVIGFMGMTCIFFL